MSLLLAAENGAFHVPTLEELFEFPAFLFEDSAYFAFNRTAMLYLLAAAIVSGLMLKAFRNPSIVPGRFQTAMEAVVELVRNNIVVEVMGPKGLRYVPLLTSFFLFIFVNNFFEIAPFINFPPTGRMAMPAFLAFVVWTTFILVGIKHQGLAYFKNAVVLPGVPFLLHFLLVPIEFISTFIVRPLTHAVRLFANMMAGHILLAVAFLATNAFLIDFHTITSPQFLPSGWTGLLFGPLTLAGSVALVLFELLVALLQAYIFTILAAVYIASSMEADH
ncbi:F0F1 ATP synthase subunit A [Nitriliruptor alkaliphilus]|uniref:F0F1 ATP synthase subunit A n=1 Tax=Nitriliruptor alkaliphilus TaxID=427918 RepID=UPI000696A438|nr:F0F1 ATP synthase subunit A [Nitriliruptor alkaliphilus]